MTQLNSSALDYVQSFHHFKAESPDMTAPEARLRDAMALLTSAVQLVHLRAYEAHEGGMRWDEIGEITGKTRQAASRNFATPPYPIPG